MSKALFISSFPQDSTLRVLYRYGGMQKHNLGTTISPIIQVLLVELDKKGESVTQNFLCSYIKLNEIYKAKLGSVWKGQVFVSADFKLISRIRSKDLIFNLKEFPPKNVNFTFIKKHFEELGCSLEILNYLNYPNLEVSDKKVRKKLESFDKTNYALLRSTKKVNVFISSIDVLNTLYFKKNILKEKLLFTSIKDLVNENLESYEVLSHAPYCYKVKTRSEKQKLGDNSIKLCAFLALNENVQNKVLLLQSSLEDIEYNPYTYKNITRFPIILPPQTSELRIRALGIWWGNNFFVTKIKDVVSIYDHIVLHEYNKDSSKHYHSLYYNEK